MPPKDTSEFQVKLEGINLSAEAANRIEKGIQSFVLQELAAYKPNPDAPDKPFPGFHNGPIIVVPRPWPGLRLRFLNKVDLQKVEKALDLKF